MVEIQKYPLVQNREDIWKLKPLKNDWPLFTCTSVFYLKSTFLQTIGELID